MKTHILTINQIKSKQFIPEIKRNYNNSNLQYNISIGEIRKEGNKMKKKEEEEKKNIYIYIYPLIFHSLPSFLIFY